MLTTDFEAEYNNRARVPEHPAIFARWEREAAAYRASASGEGRVELGVRYGATARQIIDLFLPEAGGSAPLALFIHGGYWRSLEPSGFSHLAEGLNRHGIAVAMVGYDLCPQVSIADIIGQIRKACVFMWRRLGQRMLVTGHSAGGHLAACMLATDWQDYAPELTFDLVPAAYSLSGLFDLTPLTHVSMNSDLRLDEAEARDVSPLFWPAPAGRTFDAVAGGEESNEFRRQSRVVAEAWSKAGVEARYQEIAGANHFTIIEPLADPDSDMVRRLVALSARVVQNQ